VDEASGMIGLSGVALNGLVNDVKARGDGGGERSSGFCLGEAGDMSGDVKPSEGDKGLAVVAASRPSKSIVVPNWISPIVSSRPSWSSRMMRISEMRREMIRARMG
jgi:hypothetical protein